MMSAGLRVLQLLTAALAASALATKTTVPLRAAQLLDLAAVHPEHAFSLWLQQAGARPWAHNPQSDEYQARLNVWKDNVAFIRQHATSGSSMQLGLNEYADLTWEEFSSTKLGLLGEKAVANRAVRDLQASRFRYASTVAPAAVDWREKNAVTEVKNQGQCGSCWSFSTTGAIEGVNAIYSGELVALSEQQLVDCDTEKDMGCNGGLMDYAFEYVMKNGGLDTEDDYNYWSSYGMTFWSCNRRKESHRTAVTIDGYEDVPAGEDSLKKAVANQPIAVGICASSAMQFYVGGVIDSCCDELNHGVLAVGYGTGSDGSDFWIVKNSWGGGWGEKGYFRLKRNVPHKGGLCGIATTASFPVKTSPNPVVPQMCDLFGWTECAASATCSCSYSFLGLFCVWHDCCPLQGGVTCSDNKHCCPGEAPICDVQRGACVSEDGKLTVAWTDKTPATVSRVSPATGPGAVPLPRGNKAEPEAQWPRTADTAAPADADQLQAVVGDEVAAA